VLSSEKILNHNKSTSKIRKRDNKVNLNKEKDDKEAQEQSKKMKLPPIIYDPDKHLLFLNIYLASFLSNCEYLCSNSFILHDIYNLCH
jgi:hypothetical protein